MTRPASRFEQRPIIVGLAVATAVLVATLALAEGALALLAPHINLVGQTASLFRRQAFGDAEGHVPNARGVSWGASVVTDERGFRVPAKPIRPARKTVGRVAIVGDSVAFGVGVEAEDTFAGRLARVLPVFNTAVTGHSARDYRDLTVNLLVDERAALSLSRVLMFLTLNDTNDESARAIRRHLEAREPMAGLAKRAPRVIRYNNWLIRRSRLYLAIKAAFYDSSRVHFEMDVARFEEPGAVDRLAADVGEAQHVLSEVGVGMSVFVLPYEYQLRIPMSERLLPQRTLQTALEKRGVELIDLYSELMREMAERNASSRDLFLFNDHCHLSRLGHLLVARLVGEHLGFSESEIQRTTD